MNKPMKGVLVIFCINTVFIIFGFCTGFLAVIKHNLDIYATCFLFLLFAIVGMLMNLESCFNSVLGCYKLSVKPSRYKCKIVREFKTSSGIWFVDIITDSIISPQEDLMRPQNHCFFYRLPKQFFHELTVNFKSEYIDVRKIDGVLIIQCI